MEKYDTTLKKCFEYAKKTKSHVVRFSSPSMEFTHIIDTLKSCYASQLYGSELLKRIKLQEYLILLNQRMQSDSHALLVPSTANEKVCQVKETGYTIGKYISEKRLLNNANSPTHFEKNLS